MLMSAYSFAVCKKFILDFVVESTYHKIKNFLQTAMPIQNNLCP